MCLQQLGFPSGLTFQCWTLPGGTEFPGEDDSGCIQSNTAVGTAQTQLETVPAPESLDSK